MDDIETERLAEPELTRPALVEGLPGVGHVGKLAAEHLVEEFDSELVRRVHSTHFPPKVDVDGDGVGSLSCAEFHAVDLSTPTPSTGEGEDGAADDGSAGASADGVDPENEDEAGDDGEEAEAGEDGREEAAADDADDEGDGFDPGERDLLVLTGNYQAQTGPGHYALAETFLDVAEEFGCREAYALGGVPTGELIEEYDVLGAVSEGDRVDALSEAGVTFREDEPAGGVVGVSGLLLGLGGRREIDAVCLMGETSGYLVDPKSATAVIEVLEELLGFGVDLARMDDRAEEMEEVVSKIQEMQGGSNEIPGDDELRYIG